MKRISGWRGPHLDALTTLRASPFSSAPAKDAGTVGDLVRPRPNGHEFTVLRAEGHGADLLVVVLCEHLRQPLGDPGEGV